MPEAPSIQIPRSITADAAKKAVEDLALEAGEKTGGPPKPPDPKGEETYEFTVSFLGGNGKALVGKFKNRILSLSERINVGLVASQMVGGVAMTVLDPDTVWLVQALAHLSISLVEKPEWFANMMADKNGAPRNIRAVNMVYKEVAAHENFFRGTDAPQS